MQLTPENASFNGSERFPLAACQVCQPKHRFEKAKIASREKALAEKGDMMESDSLERDAADNVKLKEKSTRKDY